MRSATQQMLMDLGVTGDMPTLAELAVDGRRVPVAYCDSVVCCGPKPSRRSKLMVDAKRGDSWCPRCDSALIWKREIRRDE